MENRNNMHPLVARRSFDNEAPVWLFETEQEARDELKRQFEEEIRIETEENGFVLGRNITAEIDPIHTYAKVVIHHYADDDDIYEWLLGDIKN